MFYCECFFLQFDYLLDLLPQVSGIVLCKQMWWLHLTHLPRHRGVQSVQRLLTHPYLSEPFLLFVQAGSLWCRLGGFWTYRVASTLMPLVLCRLLRIASHPRREVEPIGVESPLNDASELVL